MVTPVAFWFRTSATSTAVWLSDDPPDRTMVIWTGNVFVAPTAPATAATVSAAVQVAAPATAAAFTPNAVEMSATAATPAVRTTVMS